MFHSLKLACWDLKDRYGRLEYYNAILALVPGNLGMHLRGKILPRYFRSCGRPVNICQGFRFRSVHELTVGKNVWIGIDNFIQAAGGVTLEDDVMLGPGVKIWSTNHKFDDLAKPIMDQGLEYEAVSIGKGCWLAANAFVLPGVQLPEGCIVGAGSVVHKRRYAPFSILTGNPCRAVGTRKQDALTSPQLEPVALNEARRFET